MRNIGILLFIIISFDGYSQTKFETEKWLISKFDKWKTNYSYNDSFNNYWSYVPT